MKLLFIISLLCSLLMVVKHWNLGNGQLIYVWLLSALVSIYFLIMIYNDK